MKIRKPNKQISESNLPPFFFLKSDFSQGPRIERMQILRKYQNNSASKTIFKVQSFKIKNLKLRMDKINIVNEDLPGSLGPSLRFGAGIPIPLVCS